MSHGEDNNNGAPGSEEDDDGHTAVMTLDQMKEAGLFDEDDTSAPEPPAAAPAAAPPAQPPPVPEPPADEDDGEHTMMMDAGAVASLMPEEPAVAEPPPAPEPPAPEPPAPEPADDDDGEHTMMMDAGAVASLMPEEPAVAEPPPAPEPPAPESADDDDGEHTMMMDAGAAASLAPPSPKAAAPAPAAPPSPPADDDGEHTMMMDPGAVASAAPEPIAVPKLVPKVRVQEGADKGRTFELDGNTTMVGRGLDCDIILNDASVSRKHFRIDRAGSIYTLVNLSAGNGTKVNGVKVREVQLRHGAIMEAGTTTMRWEEPAGEAAADPPPAQQFIEVGEEPDDADSTRMCDLADLEALPGWEAPVALDAEPPKKGGAGRVVLIIFLVLVFLGGGFVAIDKFAKLGVIFKVDKKTKITSLNGSSGDQDGDQEPLDLSEAPRRCTKRCDDESSLPSDKTDGGPGNPYPTKDACLAGCMRKMARDAVKVAKQEMTSAKRDWIKAIAKFDEAKQLDPNVPKLAERRAWAIKESKHGNYLRQAEESLDTEKPKEALAKLGKIPSNSVYYTDALDVIDQAEDTYVVSAIDKAKDLRNEEKYAEALTHLDQALKTVKSDELASLKDDIMAEQAEAGGEPVEVAAVDPNLKTPATDPARKPDTKPDTKPDRKPDTKPDTKPDRKPDRKPATRPTGGRGKVKALFASAMAKYASAQFGAAQQVLNGIADMRVAKRHRAKAKRQSAQIATFASLYERGMGMSANQPKGIKILESAIKLDKRLGKSFQGRLKKKIAKFYAFKAQQYLVSGKYGVAGKFAKKALARDPQQKVARSVYEKVRVEAQSLLDRAKQKRSNPDLAISLLQKALQIFQSGTPGYAEANSLLIVLSDDDEDDDE